MTKFIIINQEGYPNLHAPLEFMLSQIFHNARGDGYGAGDYTNTNSPNGWGHGSFIFGGHMNGDGECNWGSQ